MTRRKRARARRARNAFARDLAQAHPAPASRFGRSAAQVRKRWPIDVWHAEWRHEARGPERRRMMRAAQRVSR